MHRAVQIDILGPRHITRHLGGCYSMTALRNGVALGTGRAWSPRV